MRAPTVLALFAAVLCLAVPALADPGPEVSIPGPSDSLDLRHGPSDITPVQGADGVATPPATPAAIPTPGPQPSPAAADGTAVPPHGPGVIPSVVSDSMRQPPTPAMPPENYRGRRMQPPVVARPDSIVSAPMPAAAEIDTEIDEEKALEIILKSDPEAARRYRSPRKAFFLSLMLPGAGQVYCGSWVKATLFVATEVSLGVGWYQVAIVQARQKEQQAERYAALHWRQQRYDSTWARLYPAGQQLTPVQVQATAPNRESLCDALYGNQKSNWASCMDQALQDTTAHYSSYSDQFTKGGTTSAPENWSQDSVLSFRSHNIKDLTAFYNVIGSQDLATGWEDNPDNMTTGDILNYSKAINDHANDPSILLTNPWGVSAMQNYYLGLRARSDELARMQKWFLGGMILNHLAAAFDAALQASRMNRELLHLQTTWLDGLGVQGGLAWASGLPDLQARVDWNF